MEALCRVIGRSICHSAPGTLAALIRSPGSLTSWMLRQNMDQMTAALLWTAAAWKGGGRGGSVCVVMVVVGGGGKDKKKKKRRRLFCVHSPRGLLSTPVCCLSSCFPRRPLSVLRANECSHCASLCVLLRSAALNGRRRGRGWGAGVGAAGPSPGNLISPG